jgi:hypothetical protein
MRVILINPWDQSVSEAEHSGELRDYYRLLSGSTIEGQPDAQIDLVDITSLDGVLEDHILVVDDEGLLIEPQAYFQLCGRTFAGRAVVTRDMGEGPTTLSLEAVEAMVNFLPVGTRVEVGPCSVTSFDTPEEMFAFLESGATAPGEAP